MTETVQSDPRGMAERWLAENDEALRNSNDFVERHGLPLTRYRRF
ncbi:MAG: type II toxin-antitoxin system CcdA family antitoxin [Burkholderiaceae bacterium]